MAPPTPYIIPIPLAISRATGVDAPSDTLPVKGYIDFLNLSTIPGLLDGINVLIAAVDAAIFAILDVLTLLLTFVVGTADEATGADTLRGAAEALGAFPEATILIVCGLEVFIFSIRVFNLACASEVSSTTFIVGDFFSLLRTLLRLLTEACKSRPTEVLSSKGLILSLLSLIRFCKLKSILCKSRPIVVRSSIGLIINPFSEAKRCKLVIELRKSPPSARLSNPAFILDVPEKAALALSELETILLKPL